MAKKQTDLTQPNRESGFDLLRIVCTIAVIMIHVSAQYMAPIMLHRGPDCVNIPHLVTISVYDTLPRFAVPCFMMLTGAFVLANPSNADWKKFYKKSFHAVGLPTILFSVLYLVYNLLKCAVRIVSYGESYQIIWDPVRELLLGNPFYHMWYLYTLLGIYLMIPGIIWIKNELGEKHFVYVCMVYFVVAVISGWTSTFVFHWSIAKSCCYLGYVLIGYQLRRLLIKHKNNIYGVLCILAAVALEESLAYVQYRFICSEAPRMEYSLLGNFNPVIALASILMFAGFALLDISWRVGRLAGLCFLIYLFHAGIWDVLADRLMGLEKYGLDARILIPLGIAIVFLCSYICAQCYDLINKKLIGRKHK